VLRKQSNPAAHRGRKGANRYEGENEPTNAVLGRTKTTNTATKITRGAAARSGDTARALIGRAKQASRRRFASEEKIRILLEGMRAEVPVAELCRREGLHPTVYYKWLKDFMEAGKKGLRGDTQREASGEEVSQLRQENERLKQLVADLSLANMTLKKSLY
jgi:transposase